MAQLTQHDGLNHAADAEPRRAWFPSWLLSLVLHALLFIVLSWSMNVVPRGTGAEVTRAVGVVLKHTSADSTQGEFYEDQADAQNANASASAAAPSPLDDAETAAPTSTALTSRDVLGFGGNPEAGGAVGSGGLLNGSSGSTRVPSGGRARAQVFGLPSEGYKFVYVFDRSASMGGSGRSALNRAKAELMASLESLGETHQFQIVFYNDKPTMFALAGQPGKLVFGNQPNKVQANKFIQGIVADGGTEHEPALLLALGLQPDVIFFLTDAGDQLTPNQVDKVTSRNRRGTVINTIEFGDGPRVGPNFLLQLAERNGGRNQYVDVTVPYNDRASGTSR